MCIGHPCKHGVLQPASHALDLWSGAVSLLVQLLRVDQVVSARRMGPAGGIVLQAKPVKTGMHKGGAHNAGNRSEDVCSDRDDECDGQDSD